MKQNSYPYLIIFKFTANPNLKEFHFYSISERSKDDSHLVQEMKFTVDSSEECKWNPESHHWNLNFISKQNMDDS